MIYLEPILRFVVRYLLSAIILGALLGGPLAILLIKWSSIKALV